jgi:hypothetical protein
MELTIFSSRKTEPSQKELIQLNFACFMKVVLIRACKVIQFSKTG